VQRDLAIKCIREQAARAIVDSHASFIAGSFDTEDTHAGYDQAAFGGAHHIGSPPSTPAAIATGMTQPLRATSLAFAFAE
jgi:hypothetical protein